ncbi:MAG: SDR family oxidoreductase [Terriglobales bacterium]
MTGCADWARLGRLWNGLSAEGGEMEAVQVQPIKGQVAVVTGAGRGIGAAIARRLAGLGAATVICGRYQPALEATARSIQEAGGQCEPVRCDVTRLESVQALATRVTTAFGGVNILVNNAAIRGPQGPLLRLAPELWDEIMNTNLRAAFYTIQAFAPAMIRAAGGDIVNIASLAGKNPLANGAAYAASKWGLRGLSCSVAEELREHNVRVSVIFPGSTDTELSPHSGKDPSRMLQPEDVAHVVAMLVTQAPRALASEVVLRPTRKP